MKAKIFYSADSNGKSKMLREISATKKKPIWIDGRRLNTNNIRWTSCIPEDVDCLIIDDVTERFNLYAIAIILLSGQLPIYKGRNKPHQVIEVPEIYMATNCRPNPKNMTDFNDYFELYEFPDITNPIN
jgi:hypothetical protein